tara:strand:- start:93 stop:557 length:465 start_codon:yes stop_codon:yes gene_type:complete
MSDEYREEVLDEDELRAELEDRYLKDQEKLETDDYYYNLQEESEAKSFFELSLKEIYYNWTITNVNIIKELVYIFSLQNYNQYFNNIEDGNQIYIGIYTMVKDIFNSFVKNDRGYYTGITMIMVSLAIYYIFITSNKNKNTNNNLINNNLSNNK